MNIGSEPSNSNFAHSFDFRCLVNNFAKKYQFVEDSFSFVVSYYALQKLLVYTWKVINE